MILNKIMLTGRLVKDAEMSFLPGTGMPKITFTIAVDRAYQKDKSNKKVDFIACEQIEDLEKARWYIDREINRLKDEIARKNIEECACKVSFNMKNPESKGDE